MRVNRTAFYFAMSEVLLAFFLLVTSAYLMVAAAIPRLRPPWRVQKDLLDWSKPAVIGPRFGLMSCLGLVICLGGFGMAAVGLSIDVRILLLGFVCFLLGGLLDHFKSSRQPPN